MGAVVGCGPDRIRAALAPTILRRHGPENLPILAPGEAIRQGEDRGIENLSRFPLELESASAWRRRRDLLRPLEADGQSAIDDVVVQEITKYAQTDQTFGHGVGDRG